MSSLTNNLISIFSGSAHPATNDEELSPGISIQESPGISKNKTQTKQTRSAENKTAAIFGPMTDLDIM